MAQVHGKGVVHSVDGRPMTGFSNKITFSREADKHDTTVFGLNAKRYQAGLRDGTASIEGLYDNAALGPGATFRPLVGGAAVDLVYRPEGVGTGRPTATVSVIVTSYEEEAAADDMISWSVDLQFSSDVTDGVQ